MASVHRHPRSPFWFGAFTENGRRVLRSTKALKKREAQEICRTWERAAREADAERLTLDRARSIISEGVNAVLLAHNHRPIPSTSVEAWCKTWLETKSVEAESSTHARYQGVVKSFLGSLGANSRRDLNTVTVPDITRFRDSVAKRLSKSSANVALKVIRTCLTSAQRQGLITSNPAQLVPVLKTTADAVRRPFTVDEIKAILKVAKDTEWEGMILMGLYSGQRLGDLSKLTWSNIDLQRRELALVTQKTKRRMFLPLAKPLNEYLLKLTVPTDKTAYVFPTMATAPRVSTLSNQFHDLLVQAGLTPARTHEKVKEGRAAKRETNPLSFHSLRHSAVTFLKAAGVTDALAREIVGHESAAISRVYTHLTTDDMRPAVDKLPDVME